MASGFFVDWDGNARSTDDPGGGFKCDVDPVAKYVAVMSPGGSIMHEATFYKSLEAIEKARIRAPLVPGSHPWGKKSDGL
ncbi:MAG TPA: hypothetical protein VFK05_01545 [Polyangiaceae bacterium]|nr:hypothetical protein [Polyangiaceae bacterium]